MPKCEFFIFWGDYEIFLFVFLQLTTTKEKLALHFTSLLFCVWSTNRENFRQQHFQISPRLNWICGIKVVASIDVLFQLGNSILPKKLTFDIRDRDRDRDDSKWSNCFPVGLS